MVFPQDANWLSDYRRYHGDDACANVRFRSWGTEELLVRCCMKYMPWLRTIHILLARESQVQPWMSRYDKVHIVFHRDFIPEKYLPCFSSPCIEMFLGRIPGLSERFVYANDDMFPLSLLQPSDFFLEGRPCVHFIEKLFPEVPNIFHRKCLNQQNMIGRPFGKHYVRTWLTTGHSYAPIPRVCSTPTRTRPPLTSPHSSTTRWLASSVSTTTRISRIGNHALNSCVRR